MRTTPSTSNSDVDPGDAPTPNPALDKLHRQMTITNNIALFAILSVPLNLAGILMLGDRPKLFGSMFVALLVSAEILLAILMKVLYVIRGGSLTTAHLCWLGVKLFALIPALFAFPYFAIASVQ